MIVAGLQTRGIFCCHCEIEPELIRVGSLWLRDWDLLGQQINLVESDGGDRYWVELPSNPLPFPAENVELRRVFPV
jgi:hypothetical protein